VRITLPSRRAAGLLAVSTIGFSTAVLGVADVASAADPGSYAVDGDDADAEHPQTVAFDVEPGTCAIDWQVTGGAGSNGSQSTLAGEVDVVTQVTPGQHFVLTAGASAALNSDEAGEASTVGRAASAGGSVTTFLSAAAGPVAGGTRDANVTQQGIGDDPVDDDAIDGALGGVNARLIDCPQEPYEPELNAGDGEATLSFGDDSDPEYTDYDAVTGYQYKVDSGAWTTVSAAPVDGEYDLHLPMTNGVAHRVSVRSLSDAGPSAAVDAGTVTPFHPVGAPSGLVVTPGMGSMKVSWSAPTEQGTFPLGDYEVYLSDPQSEAGGGAGCSTASLSCVIGVEVGHTYDVVVLATDTEGNAGGATEPVSSGKIASATPPATVPTGSGSVGTGGSTTLTAGTSVTLTGAGYLPGSTVELFIYSTPRSLGTVVAADGTFSWTGVLPADLANGQHHVVSAGVDPNGNPLYLVTAVTVSGGTAAGTSGGTSGSLAYTGFSALPYVGGGVLALAAGAGLIVASRRRAGA
jgi:hypothetical protein